MMCAVCTCLFVKMQAAFQFGKHFKKENHELSKRFGFLV